MSRLLRAQIRRPLTSPPTSTSATGTSSGWYCGGRFATSPRRTPCSSPTGTASSARTTPSTSSATSPWVGARSRCHSSAVSPGTRSCTRGTTTAAGSATAGGLPASSRREYVDAGFDEIRQGPLAITAGNREVLACHLPYRGDSGSCRRGDFQENPSCGGGEGAAAAGRMTRVSAAGVSFSVVHRHPAVLPAPRHLSGPPSLSAGGVLGPCGAAQEPVAAAWGTQQGGARRGDLTGTGQRR